MERIVDIASEGLFLSVHRGFLVVEKDGAEQGRIALDDIGGLIAHAHGLVWSNNVFVRLSERGVPVVLCGPTHRPVSLLWPLEGHYLQGARMRQQVAISRALSKQLWRQIVSAKIRMQGAVLSREGHSAGAFDLLARKVKSGDPENVEAQAARRYWRLLFGREFTRDRQADGVNGLLNYGYTVLRAIVCRAICAAGLHPTFGIFHSNRANGFALADDLMEPYRPLVDHFVNALLADGVDEVSSEAKRRLATLSSVDLLQNDQISPLSVQVERLVYSLAISFETKKAALSLPERIVEQEAELASV